MQIHQHSRAQHAVDFVLARRVHAHQPFQRPRLVRAEVIHVHLLVRLPPPHDFIHQPLEALLLLLAVQRPSLLINQFAARIPHRKPKQILQPLFPHKRVALEIHEHITRRRLR